MEKILIVDDVDINREMLSLIFEEDYEVIQGCDGEEAIEIINEMKTDISLIFLDLMMPKKTGLDVLQFMREAKLIKHIPVIMITGEATADTDMKAYEYGAADVIYKPFSAKVVTRRAMNLIEQYKSREKIEAELKEKTAALIESREQLANMNEFLLDALGSVVEFRSLESGEHVKRVKNFTQILLKYVMRDYPEYNLTDSDIRLMSQAAALHDVGKIAIPDEILKAPRRLTKEEFDEMKLHTVYGCDILERFKIANDEFYSYCHDIIRWHHEKVDGKGYPDGLVGDEIPIYCQAVAVADCFDALVSKRVYKDAVDCEESFNMIKRGECGGFSEVMMRCFELAKDEFFDTVRSIGYSEGANN